MAESGTDDHSKQKMLDEKSGDLVSGHTNNDKEDESKVSLTDEQNQKEKDKGRDKNHYMFGIILFSVLDVLLFALIIITAVYMHSEKNAEISVPDSDICLPCKDLKIHPDDRLEDGIERRGENNTICCIKDKDNADVLVGYFIDHWLKEKLAKDDRPFTRYECTRDSQTGTHKPTIKLVGKVEKQTGKHDKIIWDGTSETAIVPDDHSITHHKEHGFIEIKKSGLYQVYSQIVIDHDMQTDDQRTSPSIYQHSVVYLEAGTQNYRAREKVILKASNSHCASNTTRQTVTSYLGGAFQLGEGDKLAVEVHNKTEIVPVAHMNFFGAHML